MEKVKILAMIDPGNQPFFLFFFLPDKVPSFSRIAGYPQHNSSASNTISSSGSQRYNKLNNVFVGGGNANAPIECNRPADLRDG